MPLKKETPSTITIEQQFFSGDDGFSQIPSKIDWGNLEAKRDLEDELRQQGLIAIVEPDNSLVTMPLNDFVPEHVFTLKWNSHRAAERNIPPDWSLVPNAPDRLDLQEIELFSGQKYALEGEVGLKAVVTETGIQLTHVGMYQDVSDRGISPAFKTWGTGKVAGMGPLWIRINGWEDLDDAEVYAEITGIKAEESEGEARRVEGFPSNVNTEARFWGKDLERTLLEHVVFKDAHLQPGTPIIFTGGLLYRRQEYGARFFETAITPDIEMSGTLTMRDGREVQSLMSAHTIDRPSRAVTEAQHLAISQWKAMRPEIQVPVRIPEASTELRQEYIDVQAAQQQDGKLLRILSPEAFKVGESPNREDLPQLLPAVDELRLRYHQIKEGWIQGAGIELTLVRNGDTEPQAKGVLAGVIQGESREPIDDTITKRSAQRSYDVGGLLWDKPAPDLVLTSGRSSDLATVEIALQTSGEPYPVRDIQRDWRLNERSFGNGIGHHENEFKPNQLFSFEDRIAGGENFSHVHLKSLSLMLDLMEAANNFYREEHRPMRVLVGTHEGPMLMLQAMLNNVGTPAEIFHRIESTQTVEVKVEKPFEWPSYVSEEVLNAELLKDVSAHVLSEHQDKITSDTLAQAAVTLISYRLRYEALDDPVLLNEIDLTIEELEAGIKDSTAMPIHLDNLIHAVGPAKVIEVSRQMADILTRGPELNIESSEGLTLKRVLDCTTGFALTYSSK